MSDPLAQALASLPHGPEFRFLDRLLELTPGQSAVGQYTVHGNEPFLAGHFPGTPLFPGVLLVEAAAQLAGTAAQSDPRHAPLADLKLTAVRGAKIFGTARPGETILLNARILSRLGSLIQAEASATVNGRPVLEVQLTLSGQAPT
ncbi:MAG TPA: 3-hydroxyacyl-ACP dehydratase FabZ family protein [Methylomirabilota bacterium]|nr:3-hydroxyacyl-ACP dehydratase FabZ family protein [Methylomirabilota bacterium]